MENYKELNHDSPTSIRSFLDRKNIAPRKRWGQNFLVNPGAREKIIRALELNSPLTVWEIGPGLGAMSQMILKITPDLTVFEIDPEYCQWLNESLGNLHIIRGDVMDTWLKEWNRQKPQRIMGNLPYNTAAQFIIALITNQSLSPLNVFTVQDDIATRMTARVGSRDYSSFSVICQSGAEVKDLGKLKPGSFYPVPRVQSRIVSLRPVFNYGIPLDPDRFKLLVRNMFSERRKKLYNSIKIFSKIRDNPAKETLIQAFCSLDIDLNRRAETLSPDEWIDVANNLYPGNATN